MTEGLDLAALRKGLAALFPASDPAAATVSELAGDASTRRYYRVRSLEQLTAGGSDGHTRLLAQYVSEGGRYQQMRLG